MKRIIRSLLIIALFGNLIANAQFMEFAMGYTFEEVQTEFDTGGIFEGLRHATTNEAWFIIENFYGYDPFGSMEDNWDPAFDLIRYMDSAFISGGTYARASSFAYVQDRSNFGVYIAMAQDPDNPEFLGRIELLDFPIVPNYYVGHFLVESSYITPVPEPSIIGLIMVPAGLGLILLFKRRKFNVATWVSGETGSTPTAYGVRSHLPPRGYQSPVRYR